ncbi:PAS domain-containing protein [Nitrincola tapanii]|uniref:histidine kinase n=1 Tax=Nitrincola tapanii TaxID=1708751 RepID=A0A5A9W139_9GAMM|nr:PAS domain-containing protein [Nitrincola tapanii]KAA0874437.1 PAS domain-containing protein [Nitrincola tapanii]
MRRLWAGLSTAATTPHEDLPLQLLDSLDESVLLLDAQGQIRFCNQRWCEWIQQPPQAQQRLSDFLHPADLARWREMLAEHAAGKRQTPVWLRMVSGPQLYWCELRMQALYPESLWPISVSLCDITSQVQADQQRAAQHRGLHQLVNNLPMMLYRARNNLSWSMEYVSEGCLDLTGYSADALVNQPHLSYGELIHAEDRDGVWQAVQDALQQQQSFQLRYRIHHASGTLRWVSEKGCGLFSSTGTILGVEGAILSFSE